MVERQGGNKLHKINGPAEEKRIPRAAAWWHRLETKTNRTPKIINSNIEAKPLATKPEFERNLLELAYNQINCDLAVWVPRLYTRQGRRSRRFATEGP